MVDRRTGRGWTVAVAPFEIASTVVTVGQWNRLVGVKTDVSQAHFPKVEVSWRQAVQFCNAMSLRDGLTPAYTVTTIDPPAQDRTTWKPHDEPAPDDWFVTWQRQANGYRLPTDAEWQVACRAGSTGPRYGELDEIAWYADNSDGSMHAVARKEPNAWGLFDMLGGVWEWCWDQYDVEVYGSYRVIRGGGWSDPHWSCRVGVRRKTNPQAAFDDLGFRLARTITD
ncbi:MAG: formylglycine-generating enzyme family protein [Nocardioides sp.]